MLENARNVDIFKEWVVEEGLGGHSISRYREIEIIRRRRLIVFSGYLRFLGFLGLPVSAPELAVRASGITD